MIQTKRQSRTHAAPLAALLALLMVVTSCGLSLPGCRQPSVVCVALVTGYGSVRSGIEKEAWLALEDVRSAGTVERIDFIETNDTRDRAANIAYFVDAGYDIVVTTGAGILSDAIAAANRHPDVLFVTIQPGRNPIELPANLVELQFPEEQAGFLAGVTASLVTKTNRVAATCEARFIDYVERYCEGFAAGVKFADDQVAVTVVYRDGPDELLFQDAAWGADTASRLIREGADVVFAVGEATAESALKEAAKRGALVIGAQTDMFEALPEMQGQLVTSAILDVRQGLASVILAHVDGQFGQGTYQGHVGLAPFHTFEDQLANGAAGDLLRIETDLANGRIVPDVIIEGP